MTDLEVAHAMADAAQDITLALFRKADLSADNKDADGFDPVTQADREAELAMRAVLADLRPNDAILGEEHGETVGCSGRRWVLDPIDGTRAYISGLPTWGTLIGLEDQSRTVLGMIDQPYIGERFSGFDGRATMMRGGKESAIKVRENKSLVEATLFTTFPEIGTELEKRAFDAVEAQVKLTRYGTDCYAYALLAAGQIDLVIEAGLNSYDILGPKGLVEAAGGIVTTWEGGSASRGGQCIAAATPALHAQALEILQSALAL